MYIQSLVNSFINKLVCIFQQVRYKLHLSRCTCHYQYVYGSSYSTIALLNWLCMAIGMAPGATMPDILHFREDD
jgi:hypothetical protein